MCDITIACVIRGMFPALGAIIFLLALYCVM